MENEKVDFFVAMPLQANIGDRVIESLFTLDRNSNQRMNTAKWIENMLNLHKKNIGPKTNN